MPEDSKKLRLRYIPINKIELWREANARQIDVMKDLDDLAGNLKEVGLQNPIVVQEIIPDQKYTIISGQRRFHAAKQNGWSEIACLISPHLNLIDAKIASFSENTFRRSMNAKDTSDVCEYLFRKYDSIEKVAKSLGISIPTATKYIGYAKVYPEIKALVEDKILTVAQALSIYTKYTDPKQAIRMAKDIAQLKKRAERRSVVNALKVSSEEDDFPTVRKRAKTLKDTEYVVHFISRSAAAIKKAALSTDRDEEGVIVDSTEKWLQENEYLE